VQNLKWRHFRLVIHNCSPQLCRPSMSAFKMSIDSVGRKCRLLVSAVNIGPWVARATLTELSHSMYICTLVYTVSQKTTRLWLAITLTHMNGFWYFGRNVTDKVGNQKTLYYATSNNLCFCTTWQNAETRKSHISLNWIVLHTQCTCALSSWKEKNCHLWCVW